MVEAAGECSERAGRPRRTTLDGAGTARGDSDKEDGKRMRGAISRGARVRQVDARELSAHRGAGAGRQISNSLAARSAFVAPPRAGYFPFFAAHTFLPATTMNSNPAGKIALEDLNAEADRKSVV